MSVVTFSVAAFAKILLHASKYPHAAVNGILLSSKENIQSIEDAIPLFHTNLSLLPMFEASLYQIESYCSVHGLLISGYYQVGDKLDDFQPDYFALKFADKINENCAGACLIVVDNSLIDRDCAENPLICYHYCDGKWKESAKPCLSEDAMPSTSTLLHRQAYRSLVDFDNHLDDLTMDWRNVHIAQQIENLT